jgi:hypothetical protein
MRSTLAISSSDMLLSVPTHTSALRKLSQRTTPEGDSLDSAHAFHSELVLLFVAHALDLVAAADISGDDERNE